MSMSAFEPTTCRSVFDRRELASIPVAERDREKSSTRAGADSSGFLPAGLKRALARIKENR
jgi:hypothetical protein